LHANRASQFFGLPNVEPVQAKVMAKIEQSMAEAIARFSPEGRMGTWLSALPQGSDWV